MIVFSGTPDLFVPEVVDFSRLVREALIKSFDRLRTNGKCLIPFVVDCKDASVRATQEQLPRACRTTCAPEGMSGIEDMDSRLRGNDDLISISLDGLLVIFKGVVNQLYDFFYTKFRPFFRLPPTLGIPVD